MRSQRYRCALAGAFLVAAVFLVQMPASARAGSSFKNGVVNAIDGIVDLMADGHESRAEMRHMRHALNELLGILEHHGHHHKHHHGHMHHGFQFANHHEVGQAIGKGAGKHDTAAKNGPTKNSDKGTSIGNQVGKNSGQPSFVNHRESQQRLLAPGNAKSGHSGSHFTAKHGSGGAHLQGACTCKAGGAQRGNAKTAAGGPNSRSKSGSGASGGKKTPSSIGALPGNQRNCQTGRSKNSPGQIGSQPNAPKSGPSAKSGPSGNALKGNVGQGNLKSGQGNATNGSVNLNLPIYAQNPAKATNSKGTQNRNGSSMLTAVRSTPTSAQSRSHAGSTVGQRQMGHPGNGARKR